MLIVARQIASAAFGLVLVVGAQALAQDTTPTLVAIARTDGVMLPFAKFDRGRWMPFPARGADSLVHTPMTDELPDRWRIHFADGSPPRTVSGGSSVAFVSNGEDEYERWGQLTSFPPRPAEPNYYLPRARLGVGVSGDAATTPVVTFASRTDRSATWRDNRATIERALRRAADTLARNVGPLRLRSLYVARENVDGAGLFYIDAIAVSRAPNARRDCPQSVYYQAWFRRPPRDTSATVVSEAVIAGFDCDSPGAQPTSHRPFGVIRLAGKFFVPIEHIYYEGGDRQLFELTRTSLTPLHAVMP